MKHSEAELYKCFVCEKEEIRMSAKRNERGKGSLFGLFIKWVLKDE